MNPDALPGGLLPSKFCWGQAAISDGEMTLIEAQECIQPVRSCHSSAQGLSISCRGKTKVLTMVYNSTCSDYPHYLLPPLLFPLLILLQLQDLLLSLSAPIGCCLKAFVLSLPSTWMLFFYMPRWHTPSCPSTLSSNLTSQWHLSWTPSLSLLSKKITSPFQHSQSPLPLLLTYWFYFD